MGPDPSRPAPDSLPDNVAQNNQGAIPYTVLPRQEGAAAGPAAETSATLPSLGRPQGAGEALTFPTRDPGAPDGCSASDAAPSGPISVPGYEVLGELGRGGMGVVYKARQVALNRVVALKMILRGDYAGPRERQRFRAEAEAVARLQHSNIVQVHEVGEHQGHPYFSLEFCPGGNLASRLDGTPWQPRDAARLVETLARAMQAAHAKGWCIGT
jgi:serine/threonine protein kinase